MIAEQLWYICMVYPEPISEKQAIKAFNQHQFNEDLKVDKSYWEVVLKIIEEDANEA